MQRRGAVLGLVIVALAIGIRVATYDEPEGERAAKGADGGVRRPTEAPELAGVGLQTRGLSIVVRRSDGSTMRAPMAELVRSGAREGEGPRTASARQEDAHTQEATLRFPECRVGKYTLSVWDMGCLRSQLSFSLESHPPEDLSLRVDLVPLGAAHVRVLGRDRIPLRGARVRLLVGGSVPLPEQLHPSDRLRVAEDESTVTDRDGVVEWHYLMNFGSQVGRVLHPSYSQTEFEIVITSGALAEAEVVMRVGAVIFGAAVFDARLEFIGAALFNVDGNSSEQEQFRPIDVAGRFEFRNVRPGTKRIVAYARAPGLAVLASVQADVREGEERDVGPVAPEASDEVVLTAVVAPPVPEGASVRIVVLSWNTESQEGGAVPLQFAMAVNERTVVRGLPAGGLTLSCILLGADNRPVVGYSPSNVTLDSEQRRAPTEILIGRTGNPADGYSFLTVRAEPHPDSGMTGFRARIAVMKGEDVIASAYMSPGRGVKSWRIPIPKEHLSGIVSYCLASGWLSGPVQCVEAAGDSRWSCTHTEWRPAAKVRVQIVGGDGAAAKGLVVYAYRDSATTPAHTGAQPFFQEYTDAAGVVELTSWPGVGVRIQVLQPGFPALERRIAGEELRAGALLTVRVER